jgi:hypothetical protein
MYLNHRSHLDSRSWSCVVLDVAKLPFSGLLNPGRLGTLQVILQRVQNLLWVTCTPVRDENFAHYAAVTGLPTTLSNGVT